MILESAQMLSTALKYQGCLATSLYKPTHVNHPCNIWVRESRANFVWLLKHFLALLNEYNERYDKIHACYNMLAVLNTFKDLIPEGDLTPFANCAANKSLGLDFKSEQDTFKAYQMYLTERWDNDKRKPTWYGKEERPF
jgi:hypothetical protein